MLIAISNESKRKNIIPRSMHIAVMGIKGIPAKGGGERVAEAIIKKAVENNIKVTVYGKKSYCKNSSNVSDKINLIRIIDLKGKHSSSFFFGLFSALHALFFGKYDIIHLHYADFGYIVPFLKLRFKIIGTSHGAEYKREKWGRLAKFCFRIFERPFIKYTNVCTCVSKALSEYYQLKYKRQVLYLPNGVNFNDNKNADTEAYKKYELTRNGYILFCAGRIIPSKGCDILLKANRKLKLTIPLAIVGVIEDTRGYKKYLESITEQNVIFINFIETKRDLFGLISNCKFFVFPSTYEAMSMMLLEVASLKKGIICSDIIENIEAIGENALFFKSGDYHSLAEKIQYAINNERELDNLGQKAHDWVIEKRNWDVITKSYINIFKAA